MLVAGRAVRAALRLLLGCPLSPTLFGLYVDNLPAAVAETDGADLPCFADGRRVPLLLYADDLLLLSTSPAGLQRQLNHLEAYSAAWGLTVNAAKTKVVVFEGQRGGAAGAAGAVPAPLPTFTCGDATLDIEETFKYLGVQFHYRNAFSGAARAAAGGRVVHSLRRRCAELGLQGAATQLRLFDTMVSTVLSYGVEVWGPQLIAAGRECAATRVQLSFLRHLLGVRTSTPTLVVLAETAQLPMVTRWAKQVGRFWNGVLAADEDSLVRRALADSCALAAEMGGAPLAQQPWAGQVAAALGNMGAPVNVQQPEKIDVADIEEFATDTFRHQLTAAQGTRVPQYVAAAGADCNSLPGYLLMVPQRARRHALAQLRTGSHWLAEETGRWQRLARERRLCPHCTAAGESHVEDATHAILHCPHSAPLRAQYPDIFVPAHTTSLHAFFRQPDAIQLASFSRALYRLHRLS